MGPVPPTGLFRPCPAPSQIHPLSAYSVEKITVAQIPAGGGAVDGANVPLPVDDGGHVLSTANVLLTVGLDRPHDTMGSAQPIPAANDTLVEGKLTAGTTGDFYRVPVNAGTSDLEFTLTWAGSTAPTGSRLVVADESGRAMVDQTLPGQVASTVVLLHRIEATSGASLYVEVIVPELSKPFATGLADASSSPYELRITRQTDPAYGLENASGQVNLADPMGSSSGGSNIISPTQPIPPVWISGGSTPGDSKPPPPTAAPPPPSTPSGPSVVPAPPASQGGKDPGVDIAAEGDPSLTHIPVGAGVGHPRRSRRPGDARGGFTGASSRRGLGQPGVVHERQILATADVMSSASAMSSIGVLQSSTRTAGVRSPSVGGIVPLPMPGLAFAGLHWFVRSPHTSSTSPPEGSTEGEERFRAVLPLAAARWMEGQGRGLDTATLLAKVEPVSSASAVETGRRPERRSAFKFVLGGTAALAMGLLGPDLVSAFRSTLTPIPRSRIERRKRPTA